MRWKVIVDFPDYHHPKAPGTVGQGRFLEVELFKGSELGEWQERTRLSPGGSNGVTHDEMFGWGGIAAGRGGANGMVARRRTPTTRLL